VWHGVEYGERVPIVMRELAVQSALQQQTTDDRQPTRYACAMTVEMINNACLQFNPQVAPLVAGGPFD